MEVTGPSGNTATMQGYSPPPHLHTRLQLSDDLAAGVGMFVPFGAQTAWEDNWEGQFQSTGSSLSVYVINPEVAYRLNDRVKLGVGVQVARATVVLKRALSFVDSTGGVELGGATWGTGFNAGAQVQIVRDVLDFGISWRSRIKLDVDGKAHFSGVPAEFQSSLVDQTVKSSLELPDIVYAGLGYRPTKNVRLAFDVHYLRWSSFPSLDLNFENAALSSSQPKNWHDTYSFHLGGEVALTRSLTARAGLAYDPTPSPGNTLTPDLPDSNRTVMALGLGYGVRDFQFDLGYQILLLSKSVSTAPTYPATYGGKAQVLGLTLGWTLPI
jgi:long-chain fatty acid transport protein